MYLTRNLIGDRHLFKVSTPMLEDPNLHDLDTVKTLAITPQKHPCQCKHPCKFSWFPFVLILLVIVLYIIIITTILFYELLT